MYKIVADSQPGWPDLSAFLQLLNRLESHPNRLIREALTPTQDLWVGRAPGRLDVMGGIADYSGSLVLQMPIAQATLAALQPRADMGIHLVSLGEEERRATDFAMSVQDFMRDGRPLSYAHAQTFFQQDPARRWAAYAAGVFLVLMREKGIVFPHGANILIASDVPEAKGVSSSAALEVAVMQAVAAAYGVELAPREMALLCQKVENLVVGAPCGVMDQMTAVCGEAGELMALLCQPAELQGSVAIPEELTVWGIDSGIRHAVSGADYGSVRVGAFMGYRIIAELAGLAVSGAGQPVQVVDPIWGGYLANLPPSLFAQRFVHHMPEEISGSDFLNRYGGTTDTVTQVESAHSYRVRTPTAHPIYEHFRVRTFAELLQKPPTEGALEQLGEIMYQSHASYSACGLGSDGTDRLVELVRAAGPVQGLYGAKITGGGSGGTVAVLGRRNERAAQAIAQIAAQYQEERGYTPVLFTDSSPGAARLGALPVRWQG